MPLTVTRAELEFGGHLRRYFTVAPSGLAAGAPLILVLHGSGGNGGRVRAQSGHSFDELAQSKGLVVAYLNGVKNHWNDARAAIDFATRREGVDDTAYLRALIDALAASGAIDRRRVYAVGFSNGGQMVIRLLHELPSYLAGAVVIGATHPAPANLVLRRDVAHPVPVMLVNGTADPLAPFDGGIAHVPGRRPRGAGLSATATAEYFVRRNGITAPPTVRALSDTVTVTDWTQEGHASVRAYVIEGGGHSIPNRHHSVRPSLGTTNHDFDTAEEAWDFFNSGP
ncbi:PHB depolymerase family esterase [soil metagenome]